MILTFKKKLQKSKDDSVLCRSACEVSTWQMQGSFVSLAIPHVVILHRSPPPLPAPAKHMTAWGVPSPPPLRWVGGGGGGRTCKPVHVGWPREQNILALRWQKWGGSTRCTKASSSSILSADLKSETREVKVVCNAYLVSISCWDFDILLVSSLTIFGSAREKALQGHSIF